jgi:hypothetical protein
MISCHLAPCGAQVIVKTIGFSSNSRICRFQNLCYNPKSEDWFILKTNQSILHNAPRDRPYLLGLGSIPLHSHFYWDFIEASPYHPNLRGLTVRFEEDLHFIARRLHPRNVMHNLHDDANNLYFVIKQYLTESSIPGNSSHRVLIYDRYEATESTRPLEYLSNHPLRFGSYLDQDINVITCFKNAVVGQEQIATWYQYGFGKLQGPIPNKDTNGLLIREVAEWLVEKVGTVSHNSNVLSNHNGSDFIVIMSRKSNRLILNEEELQSKLSETFHMETVFLRNEDHSFEQQVDIMQKAKIVLSMHGSLLIMTMFCKVGTVILEMYPFGVPGDNYSPYKTLAHLRGMDLIYRKWEVFKE